jgi:hypothetical protein
MSVNHPNISSAIGTWNGGHGGGGYGRTGPLVSAGGSILFPFTITTTSYGNINVARGNTLIAGGGNMGAAGQNAPEFNICGSLSPGFGGAGGGAANATNAGKGGNGFRGGGGGGGGGTGGPAPFAGGVGGAGGNGGNGYVCIVALE